MSSIARPLFERHPQSPILRATEWPHPVHSISNPSVTRLADGTTLLLCRTEDDTGISHSGAARSTNGIDAWTIDPTRAFERDLVSPPQLWRIEDARITHVAELDCYGVAYTGLGEGGSRVALALTSDFRHFERQGVVMEPDDHDAALFPRRIGGNFALVHRPAHGENAEIWISYSPDLRSWGGHRVMVRARRNGWWDAQRIRLASPPIETPRGWLMLYHGVKRTPSGSLFRVVAALVELEAPEVCIARGASWIFAPEERDDVASGASHFACSRGPTIACGDVLHLYYGASSCIGLARFDVADVLAWLDDEKKRAPVDDARDLRPATGSHLRASSRG